ncbi:MAG: asparagine synthase (glutamine-hydrolyzing) [Candidatus Adiutrix sp.]|jgi:asparagine synthase (glutamine-hydrolysing)|nr:asparagine synthase (glutamine-hydrolyzing) [Candidatus Adiutrix sp.]
MCGIAGILTPDGREVNEAALRSMCEALIHRGPDAFGRRLDLGAAPAEARPVAVGFAHRRLSIIDLSDAAAQPMSNEDGRVWIVFNGEIYNFQPLRAELLRRGHSFKSGGDTEVIIHGYEEYGFEVLRKLNGMFAFALWDAEKRLLFMARDRFGKKPLYYRTTAGGLCFASELTALMRNPEVPAKLDMTALGRYLLHEHVPPPQSLIEGVSKLAPAQALVWTPDGGARVFSYWAPRLGGSVLRPAEAARELRRLFREAVARRMISDVPLGLFLSGGLDSACVAAAMREGVEASRIQTFSIGFQEKSFDESAQARATAAYFGTNHREEMLTVGRMLEILPEVFSFMDEPLADASVLPAYLLAGFTRRHVTVALGGDGGDEIFAGYDPFAALGAAAVYEKAPRVLRRALEGAARLLPVSARNMSLDFKIKQFLKGCRYETAVRLQAWMAAFCPDEQRKLLTEEAAAAALARDPFEPVRRTAREAALANRVEAAIHYYLSWYLSGDIMTKIDRASMAVSLEARAPFLDRELVEFVNGLPPEMKYNRGVRKFLLREAFKDILPPAALKGPKKGFGIPLTAWLRRDLVPAMRRAFEPGRLKREGLFRPAAVDRLMKEHIAGKADHRKQLWTLLMFQNWLEKTAVETRQ